MAVSRGLMRAAIVLAAVPMVSAAQINPADGLQKGVEAFRDMSFYAPIRAFFVNPCRLISPIYCCLCCSPCGDALAAVSTWVSIGVNSYEYVKEVRKQKRRLMFPDESRECCGFCPNFFPLLEDLEMQAWLCYGSMFLAYCGVCVGFYKVGEEIGADAVIGDGPPMFYDQALNNIENSTGIDVSQYHSKLNGKQDAAKGDDTFLGFDSDDQTPYMIMGALFLVAVLFIMQNISNEENYDAWDGYGNDWDEEWHWEKHSSKGSSKGKKGSSKGSSKKRDYGNEAY